MLDLRDVYRKVSSSIHDFTPEQLRNIKAIVGLYRGNDDPFNSTIESYIEEQAEGRATAALTWIDLVQKRSLEAENLVLDIAPESAEVSELKRLKKHLSHALKELAAEAKTRLQSDEVKKDKARRERIQQYMAELEKLAQAYHEAADYCLYFHKEFQWLTTRFPEGKYQDVPGLCRVVSKAEIAANDYSLTAGRYVGVAAQVDDGFDFEERMGEIKLELADLDREAGVLAGTIQEHLNELGL